MANGPRGVRFLVCEAGLRGARHTVSLWCDACPLTVRRMPLNPTLILSWRAGAPHSASGGQCRRIGRRRTASERRANNSNGSNDFDLRQSRPESGLVCLVCAKAITLYAGEQTRPPARQRFGNQIHQMIWQSDRNSAIKYQSLTSRCASRHWSWPTSPHRATPDASRCATR